MNRFGVIDDFQSSPLSLDQLMIKNQNATYFFRHRGSLMSPWVDEGDLLVVDYSLAHLYSQDLSLFHHKIALIEAEDSFLCRRLKYVKGKHRSVNRLLRFLLFM